MGSSSIALLREEMLLSPDFITPLAKTGQIAGPSNQVVCSGKGNKTLVLNAETLEIEKELQIGVKKICSFLHLDNSTTLFSDFGRNLISLDEPSLSCAIIHKATTDIECLKRDRDLILMGGGDRNIEFGKMNKKGGLEIVKEWRDLYSKMVQ